MENMERSEQKKKKRDFRIWIMAVQILLKIMLPDL